MYKFDKEEKKFSIQHVSYCFPYGTTSYISKENYGVLSEYMGNTYTLDEINDIISKMYKKQLAMKGSMSVKLSIMYNGTSCYYAIMDIKDLINEHKQITKARDLVKLKETPLIWLNN